MKANKFLRFYMAYEPIDKSHHNNFILKLEVYVYFISAMYNKRMNMVFMFEKYSKELKFYTP